jgi:hypothetical protein
MIFFLHAGFRPLRFSQHKTCGILVHQNPTLPANSLLLVWFSSIRTGTRLLTLSAQAGPANRLSVKSWDKDRMVIGCVFHKPGCAALYSHWIGVGCHAMREDGLVIKGDNLWKIVYACNRMLIVTAYVTGGGLCMFLWTNRDEKKS